MSIISNAERFHFVIKRNLWGIGLGGLCLFVGVKAIATAANARIAPVVEAPCETATDIDAVICNTPKLAALQEEMAQATMRAGQHYRFSLDARSELEQLTPQLIGMRSAAAGDDGVGLEEIMRRQVAFMNSLSTPRSSNAGLWVNALGSLRITETANGTMLQFAASEPGRNDWRCDLRVIASPEMFGGLRAKSDAPESPLQGWTLRTRHDGALLRIAEIAPEGSTGERPYCENGGGFAGVYFPAQ